MAQIQSRTKIPSCGTALTGHISKGIWVSQEITHVVGFLYPMKTKQIFSGIAGEYFVAGELSRRGFIAAVTLRNTAGVDIVASNEYDSVDIQVKTRTVELTENSWQMGSKPLQTKKAWSKSFYIFVSVHSIPENQQIEYYIIPKNLLNQKVENEYKKFLKRSKKSKQTLEKGKRVFWL